MFWQDKKVLVTGSEGLIGLPMCDALEAEGADVGRFDLVLGNDVLNMRSMVNVDVCIHLAADSNVESSRENPLTAFDVNIRGTWLVLEAAREYNVPVVIASSNHVYGQQKDYPVPESAQMNQLDTYSVTKVCADYIARAYAHNYGLPVAIMRNTNCYGPRDPHSNHIVPGTIQSILDGNAPVVHSNGQTAKSYLHVGDVVTAYLLVAEKLHKGEIETGEAFNVSGNAITALGIVGVIKDLMHDTSETVILREPNDQSNEELDSSKIRALGWEPKYTLDRGLIETIQWFRNQRVGVWV
jgi:CDP-glucose 4,6-dehydratase